MSIKKNKGKPNPALLKIAINKLKAKKFNCYYVGDMYGIILHLKRWV